jgi:hypothetical protein
MSTEQNIIGYQPWQGGYKPILPPHPGAVVTQAFILCYACNATISTVCGPRYGALCPTCYAAEVRA